MNNLITGQYNQQSTTSATPTSSAESLLNPHAEEFIPGKPQHNQHNGRSVRNTPSTSSLDPNATTFIPCKPQHTGKPQHNGRYVGNIHTRSSLRSNERPFTRSESSPFNNVSVQVTQEE